MKRTVYVLQLATQKLFLLSVYHTFDTVIRKLDDYGFFILVVC